MARFGAGDEPCYSRASLLRLLKSAVRIAAIALLLAVGAVLSPARADQHFEPGPDFEWTMTGKASAIDGDTILFRGVRMRLFGIDAPELDQVCMTPKGIPWGCGVAAKVRLQEMIGNLELRCFGLDTDRYGRNVVAYRRYAELCTQRDALPINGAELVLTAAGIDPWKLLTELRPPTRPECAPTGDFHGPRQETGGAFSVVISVLRS